MIIVTDSLEFDLYYFVHSEILVEHFAVNIIDFGYYLLHFDRNLVGN